MVKHYRDFQKLKKGGLTTDNYSLAVAKEALRATTMVEIDQQGEMMGEERWLKYATEERIPRLAYAQSQAQWLTWTANPGGADMLFQKTTEGYFFRVPIKTMINFKSQLAHEKAVELTAKAIKNPQADDIKGLMVILRIHNMQSNDAERAFQPQ